MFVSRVGLTGFRGLKNGIHDLERVNNLIGDNGSGKTSFLEALYLLCTGVSFLTKATETIANHSTSEFIVQGRQDNNGAMNKLMVSYKQRSKTYLLNNKKTTQGKMFLRHPLCLIDAYANRVISGTPDNRRSTMDRALFHVEHEYLVEHRAYNKCLKQRNMALREKKPTTQIKPVNFSTCRKTGPHSLQAEFRVAELEVLLSCSSDRFGLSNQITLAIGKK